MCYLALRSPQRCAELKPQRQLRADLRWLVTWASRAHTHAADLLLFSLLSLSLWMNSLFNIPSNVSSWRWTAAPRRCAYKAAAAPRLQEPPGWSRSRRTRWSEEDLRRIWGGSGSAEETRVGGKLFGSEPDTSQNSLGLNRSLSEVAPSQQQLQLLKRIYWRCSINPGRSARARGRGRGRPSPQTVPIKARCVTDKPAQADP